MEPHEIPNLILVQGGGGASGLLTGEALASFLRNAAGIAPPAPGNYAGVGSVVGIFVDGARTLGISPLGLGPMGHVRPAMYAPQQMGPQQGYLPYRAGGGPVTYRPQDMGGAGPQFGSQMPPGYAAVHTVPVGRQGQVSAPQAKVLRPGQPVASAYPRIMVS